MREEDNTLLPRAYKIFNGIFDRRWNGKTIAPAQKQIT
jgi:hypothetical protein